jgi:3-deoxy-D-manno-octulosonic-acid transferase
VRRSTRPDGTSPSQLLQKNTVLLGDTMGELRKFYSLADVVFVGRTLVPLGGSDPMEVAALGKPVVVGPHTGNFRLAIEALRQEGALWEVSKPDELGDRIRELLLKRDRAAEAGRRAQDVVRRHQGGTRKTVERLLKVLRDSVGEVFEQSRDREGAVTQDSKDAAVECALGDRLLRVVDSDGLIGWFLGSERGV